MIYKFYNFPGKGNGFFTNYNYSENISEMPTINNVVRRKMNIHMILSIQKICTNTALTIGETKVIPYIPEDMYEYSFDCFPSEESY